MKIHRVIDEIKIFVGENDIIDAFLDNRNFPLNISLKGGINSIRIDRFLNILYSKESSAFKTPSLSRKITIPFIKNLTTDDFILMKEFASFYRMCFDDPSKENWLYRSSIIKIIFRFWFVNKPFYRPSEMGNAFKSIINNKDLRLTAKGSDKITCQMIALKIFAIINRNRRNKRFKIFWSEE